MKVLNYGMRGHFDLWRWPIGRYRVHSNALLLGACDALQTCFHFIGKRYRQKIRGTKSNEEKYTPSIPYRFTYVW